MKVPVYERQIETNLGQAPGLSTLPSPPSDAFGANVYRAQEKLAGAVGDVGLSLVSHGLERQKLEADARLIKGDTDLESELQNRNFSTELNEKGVPQGLLNRELGQAEGITSEFDSYFNGVRQKYLSQFNAPYERAKFSKVLDDQYIRNRQTILKHEENQKKENIKNIFKSNAEAFVSSAPSYQNDIPGFINALKSKQEENAKMYMALGYDHQTILNDMDDLAKKSVENLLLPTLQTNPNSAPEIFEQVKGVLSPASQVTAKAHIDAEMKKFNELIKYQKELRYDENMRQGMFDFIDGKLSLMELQRRYKSDVLKLSDFNNLSRLVEDPDLDFLRKFRSDESSFNFIREIQLAGETSPGEIDRMIIDLRSQKTPEGKPKLVDEDVKYLMGINKSTPLDPRDQDVQAEANNIRDFGIRYFSGKKLGIIKKEEKASNVNDYQALAKESSETDKMINDFYKRVDKEKATGPRIGEIAKEVMGSYVKKKYPEVGRLEDIPNVIVGVDGKIQRLLNPDKNSKVKPKFRIVPNKTNDGGNQ